MMEPVYLHVELKIAPREINRFLTAMEEVAPLIQQSGWDFVGAWQDRVGRAYTIRVIWKLPDANAYFAPRKALVEHPRFSEFKAVIEDAVQEEKVSMMAKLPYGLW
jgi:hypothetical protein